jgi:uncharacterized membrane protein YedE/YeeE
MAARPRSPRVAGLLVGLVFGVTLSWAGMSSPDVIRDALLFHEGYLFFMFASAVATAAAGQALLRRRAGAGERLTFPRERVERRHVTGALLFGIGWGVANACPGPIATQIGQGIPWAVFPFAGMLGGIWLFGRAPRAVETEPSRDEVAGAPVGVPA